jgi:NAD(P)H-hydrate epimerase
MTGAIVLTGLGTLRSGAGLVTLAVPDPCLETVAAHDPCYMTIALPDDTHGRLSRAAEEQLLELADHATAVGCGPGLGRSDALNQLVRALYTTVSRPIVVDADALNALAGQSAGLSTPGGPRVLTPHPGEFDRLAGRRAGSTEERQELAVELARAHDVVVVLKGHRTWITDGQESHHNETGNPGMATGGAGDVLTGVITALLCQGWDPLAAARLGTHVHGRAGDLAAQRYSAVSMTARDIVSCLPEAWLLQQ